MKFVPLNEELCNYIINLFGKEDDVLKNIVNEMKDNELPEIQISPENGKLIYLILKMMNAKNVIEIGTLAGYSAIWMARALPDDGKLITIEISDKHYEFAKKQIGKAGLDNKIEIIKGKALDVLDKLKDRRFDFAFIDADKESCLSYYNKIKPLMNKNGVIAVDNTLRKGEVIKSDVDEGTKGIQIINEMMAKDPAIESILIPISDGLTVGRLV